MARSKTITLKGAAANAFVAGALRASGDHETADRIDPRGSRAAATREAGRMFGDVVAECIAAGETVVVATGTVPAAAPAPAALEGPYTVEMARRDVVAAVLRAVEKDMLAEIAVGKRLVEAGKGSVSGLTAAELPLAVAATEEFLAELRRRASARKEPT
jgi:hypothetical protein